MVVPTSILHNVEMSLVKSGGYLVVLKRLDISGMYQVNRTLQETDDKCTPQNLGILYSHLAVKGLCMVSSGTLIILVHELNLISFISILKSFQGSKKILFRYSDSPLLLQNNLAPAGIPE